MFYCLYEGLTMWTKEEWEAQGAYEAIWDKEWEDRWSDDDEDEESEDRYEEAMDYIDEARERGLL